MEVVLGFASVPMQPFGGPVQQHPKPMAESVILVTGRRVGGEYPNRLMRATVDIMGTRATFRMDTAFHKGIPLWPQQSPPIGSNSFGLARNIVTGGCLLLRYLGP